MTDRVLPAAIPFAAMGKNSKARRETREKNVQRRQRAAAESPTPLLRAGLKQGDATAARMFRTSCSECGASDLEWITPEQLAERVPAGDRPRVHEAVDMVGSGGEAWLCPRCGNFGIMG